MTKMSTVRLHIVALPYYEVGGCLGEFLAEAQGRAMTLRPDPTNDVDVNAICAYDWQGRHVGYVAIHDQLAAWQTLRGSGRRSLRGRYLLVMVLALTERNKLIGYVQTSIRYNV